MSSPSPKSPRTWSRRDWLATSAACVGAPVIAGLTACANPPALVPAPDGTTITPLAAGRQLRYRVTNLYNGLDVGEAAYRVASAPANGPGRTLEVSLPSSNTYRVDEPARTGSCVLADSTHVSQELFYDVPYAFEHPDPLTPDALGTGSSTVLYNRYRRGDSPYWLRWDSRVEGLGWERIVVPAGEFLALRVHRTLWFERRDMVHQGNTRDELLWFAPALGFWVRREWSGYFFSPDAPFQREEEDWVRFELTQA
ncbi:MAG: hypothetical protein P4L96_03765 [Rhodoferax sp.]|nr:hypothetical protein [Rhodoferax sp.]